MRIKWMAAIAAMCLATAATSAFADTVTLTFTGATGTTEPISSGESVYVYPYNFTINGTTNTSLMCISFDNEIVTPETWTATSTQLSASSSNFDKEEAYLFSLITPTTSSTNVALIQFADWYLSDASAVEATTFYKANSSAINSYASAAAGTTPGYGLDESASFYQQFELYTPNHPSSYYTSANGYPDGMPQTFIGDAPPSATPEPGSLALLGTGLVGMGGIFRRRMRKA